MAAKTAVKFQDAAAEREEDLPQPLLRKLSRYEQMMEVTSWSNRLDSRLQTCLFDLAERIDTWRETIKSIPNSQDQSGKEDAVLQDMDFALEKSALKVAKSFANKIKGAYILLDEERQCARVAKKRNGQLLTFDFADFRAKTLRGDLKKRDFTVNTLCLDLKLLQQSL